MPPAFQHPGRNESRKQLSDYNVLSAKKPLLNTITLLDTNRHTLATSRSHAACAKSGKTRLSNTAGCFSVFSHFSLSFFSLFLFLFSHSFFLFSPCPRKRRYLRISDLKVHLRSHSGERPYVCDKCQKRYITSSHLRMHQRTHADDVRLFECKVCLRTFSSSNGLTQHSYVHQKDAGHSSGGRSNPGTEAGSPMRTSGACASYGVKTFSASAPPRGGGEAGSRRAALAARLASAGGTAAAVPASAATPTSEIPCARTLCQGQRAGQGAPVAGGAAAPRPHENSANAAAACSREAPLAAACAYGLSSRATTATSARSAAPLSAKPPLDRCHSNPVSPIRSPPPTNAATESGCTGRDGDFCPADGLQHLAQAAALLHSTTSIESVT